MSNPGDCHDPDTILAALRERHHEGVVTALNDVIEGGEKVFVEITGPTLEAWDLPDGQACMVVTVRNGRIVRMQDHRSRADALADAGLAPKPKPLPPAPPEHRQPGGDRVSGLIPFVHVADSPPRSTSTDTSASGSARRTQKAPRGWTGPHWTQTRRG